MLKLGRNSVQHGFLNASFRWIFRYTTFAINAGTSNFTVEYLVNSVGFSKEEAIVASSKPAEIASFASVFNLSFERRVIPRNAVLKVLKEKRLARPDCRVLSSLKLTEQQFINKFVLPFKDEVLDLYTDYTKRADSASKTAE